jgi:hypothetical protein
MRVRTGPESVSVSGKLLLKDRAYNPHYCLLDHPVCNCWYPQLPYPATRLGYLYPPYRLRLVLPFQQVLPEAFSGLFQVR